MSGPAVNWCTCPRCVEARANADAREARVRARLSAEARLARAQARDRVIARTAQLARLAREHRRLDHEGVIGTS